MSWIENRRNIEIKNTVTVINIIAICLSLIAIVSYLPPQLLDSRYLVVGVFGGVILFTYLVY